MKVALQWSTRERTAERVLSRAADKLTAHLVFVVIPRMFRVTQLVARSRFKSVAQQFDPRKPTCDVPTSVICHGFVAGQVLGVSRFNVVDATAVAGTTKCDVDLRKQLCTDAWWHAG